jgi:hypothetical protein
MRGRANRRTRLAGLGAALLLTGCELGRSGGFVVMPGPSVPSPLPATAPYVWDTREELDIWVHNPVTRGPAPISLVGDGRDAIIRIEPKRGLEGLCMLRGPDFATPARHVSGLRLSYRWRPDPTLGPGASLIVTITASFEAINGPRPPEQPTAGARLEPAADWTDASVRPGSFRDPLDVEYLYLQFSANPGVFEIDRIELVQ